MGWKMALHAQTAGDGCRRRRCCSRMQWERQPGVRRCGWHAQCCSRRQRVQCCSQRQLVRSLDSAPLARARRPLAPPAPPQLASTVPPQKARRELAAQRLARQPPAAQLQAVLPIPQAAGRAPLLPAAETAGPEAVQLPLPARPLARAGPAAEGAAAPVEPRHFRPTWEGSRSGGTSAAGSD